MKEEKEKIILFLGDADSSAVTAKLKATNTLYKRKMLESSLENWKTILEYFDNYEVISVTVKLINSTFNVLCQRDYQEVLNNLLTKITSVPYLFVCHENLITEDTEQQIHKAMELDVSIPNFQDEYQNLFPPNFYYHYFQPPKKEVKEKVINILQDYKINLTPYKTNAELAIIVSSFLEQNEHNLIFRFYIPCERMWANEAEKLLQLFREYLQRVGGFSVRQDQFRTNQGVIYEFFADDIESSTLPEKFREFTEFMDACSINPDNAQIFLESKKIGNQEISSIIERYSKEAKRLQIDLKQERERKLLSIRHRLESELAEHITTDQDWNQIYHIVNSNIPQIVGVSDAIKLDQKFLPINSQNLTINIRPQIIESVNSVIGQEIIGNQHLGITGTELLEIIDKYGNERKMELATALHELTDIGIKKDERLNAKQKLKGFILSAADKIGDVAVKILQKYIESQIGL